jgi:ATP-dependent protease HslVU (ClpYQ) peptidase subunit
MGQIIEFAEDIPCLTDKFKNNGYAYLVKEFIPHIRKLFKDEGFTTIKNNEEKGGNFLVGINGELFEIQSDFSVLRSTDGFSSVGSGESYALGAVKVLLNGYRISPIPTIIKEALEVSEHFSSSVRSPFYVLSL